MTKESWPTNQQVFDYYANKNDNTLVKMFSQVTHKKESGDYPKLFGYFNDTTIDQVKQHTPENIGFQEVIRVWKNKERDFKAISIQENSTRHTPMPNSIVSLDDINLKLSFLTKINDLHILEPSLDGTTEENQRWHLLISVFAYNVVCGYDKKNKSWMWNDLTTYWSETFFYPSQSEPKTPYLKLWMIENAMVENEISSENKQFMTKKDEIRKNLETAITLQKACDVAPDNMKVQTQNLLDESTKNLIDPNPHKHEKGLINEAFKYLMEHWNELYEQ